MVHCFILFSINAFEYLGKIIPSRYVAVNSVYDPITINVQGIKIIGYPV